MLQRHEAAESSEPTTNCTVDEYPRASVTVRAAVEVAAVDYPRVSSDVVIRVPQAWGRAPDLLGDPDHGAYRAALRCLLGDYSKDFSVYRDGPPTVMVSGGEVVVHDHVWTELVKPGHGAVGAVDLTVGPGRPWRMAVVSRGGLIHSASWTVTIAAPQDWLNSAVPEPWPPHAAEPGELTWLYGATSSTGEGETLAVADLTPDVRAAAVVWEGSMTGDLLLRGTGALNTAAFLVVVLIFIRRVSRRMPRTADPLVGRAWSVTVPLVVLQVLGFGVEITRVVLNAQGDQVPDWSTAAWAADIAVGVTILVIARCFGVRRKPQLAALRVLAVILLIGWLLADLVAFTNTQRTDYALILRLSESAMVFVVTVFAVAAMVHAIRAFTQSGGERPKRVWWVWPVASIVAGVLLVERVWTALRNDFLQQWMYDPTPLTETLRNAPRFTIWSMPANWLWVFALMPAIAVFALSNAYLWSKEDPKRRHLMMISLALLVVGPAQWSLTIYGFDLPLWLLVATAFWLFCRIGKPILDRDMRSDGKIRDYVTQRSVRSIRIEANRWLTQTMDPSDSSCRTNLPRGVTPVDVVLALGAGNSPRDNMTIMVKLSLRLGVVVGLAVYLFREIARVDLTGGLPDSVVIGYFVDISWEVIKWVFAAAVLGIFWRYLPGKRGPIKVLPLAFAYVVGAVCVFLASIFTDGTVSTDGLIDGAVFAIVLIFLGLAMDVRTLRDLRIARYLTLKERLKVYGVSDLPSGITAALAPVSAVITLVFTIIAGPQSDSKPEVQSRSPDTVQNKPDAAIR
ncbi:DUF6185 family protein [Amycolatopsis sp. NPDC051061]|uniref:DUF6185 family protein n=1 Tax=Amycolatopsis sp. NPDC051061 TaxID=3155042 RepID=UPI003418AC9B